VLARSVVEDVMSRGMVVCREDTSIAAAARAMTDRRSRSVLVASIVSVTIFFLSVVSNYTFFSGIRSKRTRDNDNDRVELIEVEAADVIEIEHHGSHGPAHVFFSDDGKALLLVGQWQLDQVGFPAKKFTIFKWQETGDPIRVESQGPKIEPLVSAARLPSGRKIPDVAVFRGQLATIQDDLDLAFADQD